MYSLSCAYCFIVYNTVRSLLTSLIFVKGSLTSPTVIFRRHSVGEEWGLSSHTVLAWVKIYLLFCWVRTKSSGAPHLLVFTFTPGEKKNQVLSLFLCNFTFRDETLVRFTEDGGKEDLILTLREKDEDIYDFLQDELKIFYKICAQMESKLNQ